MSEYPDSAYPDEELHTHLPVRAGATVDIGEMSGVEADVVRGILRAEPVGRLATTPTGPALSIAANLAAAQDSLTDGRPAPRTSAASPPPADLAMAANSTATNPIATNSIAANSIDATALASGPAGTGPLALLLATVLDGLDRGRADWLGPLPPGGPHAVREAVASSGFGVLPDKGEDPFETLAALGRLVAWGSADPAHPHCAAHLHCPPLATSVAAETAVAALNQSLDSWDQSPAAGEIEERIVRTLTRSVGYPDSSAGVLTSGGTESNLMGLLLARDDVLRRRFDADPDLDGVPPFAAGRMRILASDQAHFSVARNAAVLGLGERSVIPVASDPEGRMRADALGEALGAVVARDEIALAVVGTAGTTDLGAIDPLGAIAKLAARHGAWFHVDAAYGGGLLLGTETDDRLHDLHTADSVTLDLHKLGWQPVPAGCFLVKHAASLRSLEKRVSYLNSADDEQAGYPSLLGRSLRTTRRADAVKLAAAFRALGREGFQQLTDRCRALARYAAAAVQAHPDLELTAEPHLTTVLFRYLPPDPHDADRVNGVLRRHLLEAGRAVLGRTELARERPGTPPGRVRLKLTLLNPHTTEPQIDALLAAVRTAGGAASAAASAASVRGPS
ncbi:pyridoxal phosphate-dependent decarboxylase family protein [Catenulispora pinisilvae]|uniref:pyridoxal phosphate-dependent decarboxylase family protein n=1 Tax=Catenulispora pinisilvae TaxID=2705253 RepID=UPI002B27A591|nr:pyridoxal-dependent decarboxylase [Catenulispora pinisilvae]